MNFDPVGSEEAASPTDIRRFTQDRVLVQPAPDGADDEREAALDARGQDARDEEEEDYERGPAAREGLPARFRMRHTPHYVDELLGGLPLRTVREIPLAEIEAPPDDRTDLDTLERSIRRLGVIEPLLVGRRGASYRVIAGMRRLRAAQRIGLDTVPCLVHDVDEERLTEMRAAAAERVTIPPEQREAEEVPRAFAMPPPTGEGLPGLEFVSALLPAMSAAGNDRLRLGVLADLAGVECSRAKTTQAALRMIDGGSDLVRQSTDPVALVGEVVSAAAVEARLRGVRVDVSWPPAEESSRPGSGLDIALDSARCRAALTGLVQCLLALAPRVGTVLALNPHVTRIRPALILECLLNDSDPELSPEAVARFFDAGWREHPCGIHGGPMLAALAHTARAHGGRVDVKTAGKGCLVTFVVPKTEG